MHQLNIIEKTTRKACKRYQSLSKEEKERRNNIVINDTKTYRMMNNKTWFSIERKIIK